MSVWFLFGDIDIWFYFGRDAKDAVYSRDGYDYDGYKLRVEFPRGRERGPGGVFKSGRERESARRGGGGGGGGGQPTRRSNYRVKVTGECGRVLKFSFLMMAILF